MQLTRDQIYGVMLEEIEYQLTIMKQYLSKEETEAYILLLKRYSTIAQEQAIMKKHQSAWG